MFRRHFQRLGTAMLILLSAPMAFAGSIFTFTFDTTPLLGHPAGPFSLNFQFNDGSFPNDANNSANLTLFDLGGGSLVGLGLLTGGVAGDLSSSVLFQDSSFLNMYTQGFNVGSALSFGIDMTTFLDSGDTPDQFSFAILDNTGTEIPTTALGILGSDVLVSIDIVPSLASSAGVRGLSSAIGVARVQVFATDATRTPIGGGDHA